VGHEQRNQHEDDRDLADEEPALGALLARQLGGEVGLRRQTILDD
jgi:hypothetical protein